MILREFAVEQGKKYGLGYKLGQEDRLSRIAWLNKHGRIIHYSDSPSECPVEAVWAKFFTQDGDDAKAGLFSMTALMDSLKCEAGPE